MLISFTIAVNTYMIPSHPSKRLVGGYSLTLIQYDRPWFRYQIMLKNQKTTMVVTYITTCFDCQNLYNNIIKLRK